MRLDIRVQPKAGRNTIEVSDDGAVRIRVTASPDSGKANEAAVELLAKCLQVPKSAVRIVRGHRARDKTFDIDGISPERASVLLSG